MAELIKKRPYNIREKKKKNTIYENLINGEVADKLYDKILNLILVQKRYRDPSYSAKEMARELNTNTRYLSAVINSRFNMNYSCLINEYRIKEVKHLIIDRRYVDYTIEDIANMAGFANRQSFYASFYKYVGETPKNFRIRHFNK